LSEGPPGPGATRARADPVVLLGRAATVAGAERWADRLVIERIGATARGVEVWVREADRDGATVLSGLFREIDEGRSRVAPSYASLWQGPFRRQVLGAVALVGILAPAIFVFFVAMQR